MIDPELKNDRDFNKKINEMNIFAIEMGEILNNSTEKTSKKDIKKMMNINLKAVKILKSLN